MAHDARPGAEVARAADIAARGFAPAGPDLAAELQTIVLSDPDPRVRAVALAALVRSSPGAAAAAWRHACRDDDAFVRRRAAEVAPGLTGATPDRRLVTLLSDPEPLVAEAAAAALGELPRRPRGSVAALATCATTHPDPLVREAGVAALGSLGHPDGLAAVLAACTDRPAIRRRAVLALAAFEGPAVEAALEAARSDRDRQVREAAEMLLSRAGPNAP